VTTLAGRYEIIRQLGGGGFAITFLARDIMQPSIPLCVVKQLRPNQTHPKVIEFFHKEAAILERLGKHPQIPQLLAHFQEDDNLYIVQEFIEGHDLNNEICSGQPLSEAYVRKLLQDVLEILSFVHQQGVIHRDIKPQNLMRCRKNEKIFLIDFGAVKEIGSLMLNSGGELVSSMAIGTPGYMPQEQSNGRSCFASDIYALGMTAIKALTGIKPHELKENPETGEIIWLEQVQVSRHLAEVISKMVRRHPSLRYPCAKDALQALVPQLQSKTQKAPILSLYILNKLSRRKILKIIGFAGSGLLITVVQNKLFTKKLSLNPNEVLTVDESGKIVNRQPLRAKYFTEDLGNGVTLEMAQIPGGEFFMGSPASEKGRQDNESPRHEVTINPFFMGKFTITQAQYKAIMGKNPSYFQSMFGDNNKHPVEQVSCKAAVEFCKKLTDKTGRKYRLPSEAEWEYACRAQTLTPFHFGETITTDLANYDNFTYADEPRGEDRNETTEVGIFPPNAFGLYDMHGNVLEWCQDSWYPDYNDAPTDGSARINNDNDSKVLRGGSWRYIPAFCRSAKRHFARYHEKNRSTGFRVVCVAPKNF